MAKPPAQHLRAPGRATDRRRPTRTRVVEEVWVAGLSSDDAWIVDAPSARTASEAEAAFWGCQQLEIPLCSHERLSYFRWPDQDGTRRPRSIVPAFEGHLAASYLGDRDLTSELREGLRALMRAWLGIALPTDDQQLRNWVRSRRRALAEFTAPCCSRCDMAMEQPAPLCGFCEEEAGGDPTGLAALTVGLSSPSLDRFNR